MTHCASDERIRAERRVFPGVPAVTCVDAEAHTAGGAETMLCGKLWPIIEARIRTQVFGGRAKRNAHLTDEGEAYRVLDACEAPLAVHGQTPDALFGEGYGVVRLVSELRS